MKRIGTYFGCLWPCIVFLFIQIVVSAATTIVMVVAKMAVPSGLDWEARIHEIEVFVEGPGTILINVVATLSTAVAGYVWYHTKYQGKRDYKLREVARPKDYLYIVVLAFTAFFGSDIVFWLYSLVFPQAIASYEEVVDLSGLGSDIYMIAAAILLAPIGEECFYRGLILRKSESCMPFWTANLFQALLFGAMHMNLVQSSYAFLLGLILGYICNQYDSVRMGILLHMLFNIVGQLLPFMLPEIPDTIYNCLIGASILIILVVLRKLSRIEIPKKTVPQLIYMDEPSGHWENENSK